VEPEEITVRLSRDQALVLSDWLYQTEQSGQLNAVITEPAVWSALWRIGGTLETSLVGIFASDYSQLVADAAARLELTLGDCRAVPEACPSDGGRTVNDGDSREIESDAGP
jgi:hypothetical protein